MIEHDLHYWKVGNKMIKDDEDRERLEQIIKENYVYLKECFQFLVSKSMFPGLASPEYIQFV